MEMEKIHQVFSICTADPLRLSQLQPFMDCCLFFLNHLHQYSCLAQILRYAYQNQLHLGDKHVNLIYYYL